MATIDKGLAEFRLKCVEAYIVIASRLDIEQDKVFDKAEKLYKFCLYGLDTTKEKTP